VVVEPWIEQLWNPLFRLASSIQGDSLEASASSSLESFGAPVKETNGFHPSSEQTASEADEKPKESESKEILVLGSQATLQINYPVKQELLKGVPKVSIPVYQVLIPSSWNLLDPFLIENFLYILLPLTGHFSWRKINLRNNVHPWDQRSARRCKVFFVFTLFG